jgi:ParB/RepB/Spo0J family partition protein
MTKKGKACASDIPARIETIPAAAIKPNAWNKRRAITEDFVESIKVNGILQPPVVRPVGKTYEIVCGERRWQAAKAAGLAEIQCKVIVADDERARELTLVENIDRENLTPLEEAAEIAELVKLHGGDAVEVAARLGRSRHFVKSRLALSRLDLSIFENTDIVPELVPVACLELLAKAPPETQKKIVGDAYGGISDYEALRNALVELSRKLGGGLFDAEDETLVPAAGACADCPKRTGADPDLFGNVAGLMKGDHCLDESCYAAKVRAGLARKEAEARNKHPGLILAARSIPYADRREAEKRKVEQIDAPYRSRLTAAKKGEEGAAPAFLWGGPGAGTVTWVKPTAAENLPANARPKTLEEKRAALEARRHALVVENANKIIMEEPLHKSFHSWEHLCLILLKYGCRSSDAQPHSLADAVEMTAAQTRGYRQVGPADSKVQILEALLLVYGPGEASEQLEFLEREAAEALPEPKSWAKMEPA